MADSNSSSGSSSSSTTSKSSSGGFLTRKIFGIPMWVIVLGIVAIYYWYTHYGPGAKKQQQAKQPQRPVGRGRGGGGTRVIVVRGGGGHHRHTKGKASPRANSAAATAPGGNVGGGAAAMAPQAPPAQLQQLPQPFPTGGAIDAQTGAPVYAQYQQFYGAGAGGDGVAQDGSVPDPTMAYAPMTGGGIYG